MKPRPNDDWNEYTLILKGFRETELCDNTLLFWVVELMPIPTHARDAMEGTQIYRYKYIRS